MYREGERDTTGRYTHIFLLFYMYRERERYYLQIHTHSILFYMYRNSEKSVSQCICCMPCIALYIGATDTTLHTFLHTHIHVCISQFAMHCIVLYIGATDTTLLQTLLYYRHYFTTDTTLLQTLLYYRHYFTSPCHLQRTVTQRLL